VQKGQERSSTPESQFRVMRNIEWTGDGWVRIEKDKLPYNLLRRQHRISRLGILCPSLIMRSEVSHEYISNPSLFYRSHAGRPADLLVDRSDTRLRRERLYGYRSVIIGTCGAWISCPGWPWFAPSGVYSRKVRDRELQRLTRGVYHDNMNLKNHL
jgi:hypothetical protein